MAAANFNIDDAREAKPRRRGGKDAQRKSPTSRSDRKPEVIGSLQDTANIENDISKVSPAGLREHTVEATVALDIREAIPAKNSDDNASEASSDALESLPDSIKEKDHQQKD